MNRPLSEAIYSQFFIGTLTWRKQAYGVCEILWSAANSCITPGIGISSICGTIVMYAGLVFMAATHKRILPNIPLACLKLSLVVFYSFLDVPYLYLFYTSSFVSLITITYFMLEKTDERLRVN